MSREISENVKRKLYAESMGRCMNPNCKIELFQNNGDIVEKAHIDPYCDTADNSFENLVVLCPNCHTKFDKLHQFNPDEVLNWKQIRKNELEKFFCEKFTSFEDLKSAVFPLLSENKTIYENYYLSGKKELWNKFEVKILINNKKLKLLLENNFNLIQRHSVESYSNLHYIQSFVMHIEEFEKTRLDEEKSRHVLFPEEINSIFGISPVDDTFLPSTESLEVLIEKLTENGKFEDIVLGIETPYIKINESGKSEKVYLSDTPRLRQMYYNYNCFRKCNVRLDSLNFALKYIKSKRIKYDILNFSNLRTIHIKNTEMIFVYEYCLSKAFLSQLAPPENCIVVNLHNWNGCLSISKEAYEFSDEINVKLLNMNAFMDISMRSRINNITDYIKRNIFLFKSFTKVYLFGSILNDSTIPNDIDIILIYSEYSYKIQQDSITISSALEEEFGLPVDLTVLSINEEKETKFLDRLNSLYVRLK